VRYNAKLRIIIKLKLKMKFSKPYLNLDNVELGQAQKTIQKKMADLYESTPELEKSKSK
jgi:hypothetical protein